MVGILRHSTEPSEPETSAHEFDRQQVRKNTELNAKLGEEGSQLRGHLKAPESPPSHEPGKRAFPKTKAPTALRPHELEEDEGFVEPHQDIGFDEKGIKDWDKHRGQAQKILEPNTPYMGTAADTEYYDDDPVPDDLDLGGSA